MAVYYKGHMTKRKSTITVQALMQTHNPEIKAVVSALRGLILETVPDAVESANAGWHSISFRTPEQGYFCGIFPEQERVILVFEYGILLPDPDGVLEGDGKQVRNVILDSQETMPAAAIKRLIFDALSLPRSRAEKLTMIRSGARVV